MRLLQINVEVSRLRYRVACLWWFDQLLRSASYTIVRTVYYILQLNAIDVHEWRLKIQKANSFPAGKRYGK